MDPKFQVPEIDPSLIGASIYYVPKNAREARRASVTSYAVTLADNLERWQAELTAKGAPEDTTVAVVTAAGALYRYTGPMTYARHAALARAGVTNLPTYGPNR